MTRVKDWEKRLKAVIEKHMALPSEFGVSDCYIIADDAVEAVTGEQMFEGVRDYTNELGAAKYLKRKKFANVEVAFASKFEAVAPTLAHRGDIGVIDNDGAICGGFFSSVGFVARGKDRLLFLPVSQVKTAFKVGR